MISNRGITAVQLATGKTLWDEPLGEARENGLFGMPSMLPFAIGTPNNGGALITAGGLVFIAAATDNLIRAIDIDTGKVRWQDKLSAGGQATPMAFEANGREYIGFMARTSLHGDPGGRLRSGLRIATIGLAAGRQIEQLLRLGAIADDI